MAGLAIPGLQAFFEILVLVSDVLAKVGQAADLLAQAKEMSTEEPRGDKAGCEEGGGDRSSRGGEKRGDKTGGGGGGAKCEREVGEGVLVFWVFHFLCLGLLPHLQRSLFPEAGVFRLVSGFLEKFSFAAFWDRGCWEAGGKKNGRTG